MFSDELKNSSPLAANDWSRQTLISKISTDLKNHIMDVLSDKRLHRKHWIRWLSRLMKPLAVNKMLGRTQAKHKATYKT